MQQRFVSIWFRHLLTDWLLRKQPDLSGLPYVMTAVRGSQMQVMAANEIAENAGVYAGMVLADARALIPKIEAFDYKPELVAKIIDMVAEWCTRYTPAVAVTSSDGLILEITGCAHLKGGEHPFLREIVVKLRGFGYDARAAMADTIGTAWAVARYGTQMPIIPVGQSREALLQLPPASLRLTDETALKLNRLGINRVASLLAIPRAHLNRRFGQETTLRLAQALGEVQEKLNYRGYLAPYAEDLMTPHGVATAEGIAEALKILLDKVCQRLFSEHKGARGLIFDGFRVDGKIESIQIGTGRPTRNPKHLMKLFQEKLPTIEPALGIEQFRLSADKIEDMPPTQDEMLNTAGKVDDDRVQELIDRLSNRFDRRSIRRYLPEESHWPERSVKLATSAEDHPATAWAAHKIRPVTLLPRPMEIQVTAPVPDYAPMFFRHAGKLHRVKKADGPERIEQEWWLKGGEPRDYFRLEDEEGRRFWVFRSGPYKDGVPSAWFLHGFFA